MPLLEGVTVDQVRLLSFELLHTVSSVLMYSNCMIVVTRLWT